MLLVTGGPGVGKSFLVDVFDEVSKIIGVGEQLRMALYGVAAVNIDGTSLLALMDIPTDFNKNNQQRVKDWKQEKLQEFKKKYDLDRISVIVIDEISTVKPYMLGYLNARLQTACCSDKLFGGKAIVFLGDFDQLPPVGSPSIPEVAMMIEKEKHLRSHQGPLRRLSFSKKQFELTSIVRQGVELFTNAIHINLTEQHRSEDQEHTDLLMRMSSGETICPNDLKNYKVLNSEDKSFEFATILTPGNRERFEFNSIQSKRWAVRKKTSVIRWPRRIRNWKGKPSNPSNVERAKAQEGCFWELFVPQALAYLTSNLKVDKGLANGVTVKYDSISFSNLEDQDNFENLLSEAVPGTIITLEGPPDYINVELFPDFDGDDEKIRLKNEAKRRQWKFGSITEDGRIVVPLDMTHSKKFVQWKSSNIRGGGGFQFRPSTAEFADHFPLEPGFSVTIHKAQVSLDLEYYYFASETLFHILVVLQHIYLLKQYDLYNRDEQ